MVRGCLGLSTSGRRASLLVLIAFISSRASSFMAWRQGLGFMSQPLIRRTVVPRSLRALLGQGGGRSLTYHRSLSSNHGRVGSILARRRLALADDDAEWTSDPGYLGGDDTIFALSSGQGRAGVAVIRVSGPQARQCLQSLITPPSTLPPAPAAKFPEVRRACLRRLYDPSHGDVLDEALVLWFPGPRSFTGEDTVELQVHGSRAVIQGVTEALLSVGRNLGQPVRPAEAGEFTQRAFANGRMDLTEVEGLADLLAADTTAQRRQALRQMGGSLRVTYEGWREELKRCLAHTEAVIDFADDEHDVDDSAYDAIRPRVAQLRKEMQAHLADGNRGEIIRSGIRVAIVGPPNAGKSTLLNLLAKRPAAIVSPIAGTTRDVVEVQLEIGGLPVLVSDTAGIRDSTDDPIEQEGIRRAREAAEAAHLTIIVLDGPAALSSAGLSSLSTLLPPASRADLSSLLSTVRGDPSLVLLLNKQDMVADPQALLLQKEEEEEGEGEGEEAGVYLASCSEGVGVDRFLSGVEKRLRALFDKGEAEAPLLTRARHRVHVEGCVFALTSFLEDRNLGLDMAAEELRLASTELGRITGAVDVEEILDVIFRDFCIGK